MGILVLKSDGHKEVFDDADSFNTSLDGTSLYVLRGSQTLGIFAPGGWSGVRSVGSKPLPDRGIRIDGGSVSANRG